MVRQGFAACGDVREDGFGCCGPSRLVGLCADDDPPYPFRQLDPCEAGPVTRYPDMGRRMNEPDGQAFKQRRGQNDGLGCRVETDRTVCGAFMRGEDFDRLFRAPFTSSEQYATPMAVPVPPVTRAIMLESPSVAGKIRLQKGRVR